MNSEIFKEGNIRIVGKIYFFSEDSCLKMEKGVVFAKDLFFVIEEDNCAYVVGETILEEDETNKGYVISENINGVCNTKGVAEAEFEGAPCVEGIITVLEGGELKRNDVAIKGKTLPLITVRNVIMRDIPRHSDEYYMEVSETVDSFIKKSFGGMLVTLPPDKPALWCLVGGWY